MTHYINAHYDDSDKTFLPPTRTIGFNPQLTMNDSLLVQSYIEAYDISYPEALRRIEDEVNEIKQYLSNEGRYEMNDLGVLSMNENGVYTFEPCEAGILTPDLYGLNSVEFTKLADEEVKQVEFVKESVAVEEPKPATVIRQTSVFDYDDEEEDERTISIRVSLLRNIAAACIAIIVFFAISTPLGNNGDSAMLKSKIDTGLLNRIIPKDITSSYANVKYVKQETPAVAKKNVQNAQPSEKQSNAAIDNKEPFYSIVLASKVARKNAAEYVDRLHKKGLNEAQVLAGEGISTKVIYGHYATRGEAYSALGKLNDQREFSDSWVTRVNY